MSNNVHFMSQRQDWETPQFLFDALDKEFGFEFDVCATPDNAKCRRFYTEEDDGLAQPLVGCVLDESTLRPCHRQLDEEGIRVIIHRRAGRLPRSRSNGHAVVAQVRQPRLGNSACSAAV